LVGDGDHRYGDRVVAGGGSMRDRASGRPAELCALIERDHWRMAVLGALATEGLPEAWVAAGFVRNAVWDQRHGFTAATPLLDVDVVFFDSTLPERAREQEIEARLRQRLDGVPWSVKNQARMHRRNGDRPYRSTADALTFWRETATPVAVRLDPRGKVELLAPLGLDDLFDLIVRPTLATRSHPDKLAQYQARMAQKNWPARWPRLRLLSTAT
jgi:hypothetical protein